MTRYVELIAKLQAAPEGSRELSDEVLLAAGWTRESHIHPGLSADYGENVEYWEWTQPNGDPCPRYHLGGQNLPCPTTSLDAALTLVPEGAQYCLGCLSDTRVSVRGVSRYHAWVMEQETVYAPTPALTLCIAALKARSAKESNT